MRNILGAKICFKGACLLFCMVFFSSEIGTANSFENLGKAVIEKYEETSKPLFEAEEPAVKEKLKGDPFFDKMRKRHSKFTKEEQTRRRDFIEKVREKDWPDEKRQEKLAQFQKKELAARKKFIEKQQEKLQKHQGEGS